MESRNEELLQAILDGQTVTTEPQSRSEALLKAIANKPADIPESVIKEAVDTYVSEHSGDFATKTDLEALNEDIADLENRVETLENKSTLTLTQNDFTTGYYGSNGIYYTDGANSNITSIIIPKDRFKKITITPRTNYMCNYCKFNGSTFVSRSSWTTNPIEITNDYSVVIMLATQYSSSQDKNTVFNNFTIDIESNSEIDVVKTQAEFLNKIVCSDVNDNIVHFSVDDTYACIKDLTNNEYSSIFDNDFLNSWKTLHDTYGVCVTLNTFNTVSTDTSYSISNVPTRYQTEFQANKDWLKFGFHAENDTSDYSTSTGISTSYDTFVTAIYKLTGDYDCIDRFTRLGFFGGSLNNIVEIAKKTYGVKGLLCADETSRNSYYLDNNQNNIIQQKGKYYDLSNNLVFIKTQTRTLSNVVTDIESNICYKKYVEVFMHEYENGTPQSKFETMAQYFKNNGYIFTFPSLILG